MSTGRIKAHRGRTGVAGHAGLGAASAREEGPQAKHRCGRPQWRAAAGGGARRGRVTYLDVGDMHVGDAGASALAAALDQGALPRLNILGLQGSAKGNMGNAGLVALAPALRRRPALEGLGLSNNPLSDEGLAALVAPPPPAGPPPTGGLTKLKRLYLCQQHPDHQRRLRSTLRSTLAARCRRSRSSICTAPLPSPRQRLPLGGQA